MEVLSGFGIMIFLHGILFLIYRDNLARLKKWFNNSPIFFGFLIGSAFNLPDAKYIGVIFGMSLSFALLNIAAFFLLPKYIKHKTRR